jgi:hypothetical protein
VSEYDYEIIVPSAGIRQFRELLRAGIDALGEDEKELIAWGKDLLQMVS